MNTYFGYIYNVLCFNIFNCLGNQQHFRERYDYTTNNYTNMRMDNVNNVNDDNNVNDNNATIIDIDDENSFMIRGEKFHIDNDFIK